MEKKDKNLHCSVENIYTDSVWVAQSKGFKCSLAVLGLDIMSNILCMCVCVYVINDDFVMSFT